MRQYIACKPSCPLAQVIRHYTSKTLSIGFAYTHAAGIGQNPAGCCNSQRSQNSCEGYRRLVRLLQFMFADDNPRAAIVTTHSQIPLMP